MLRVPQPFQVQQGGELGCGGAGRTAEDTILGKLNRTRTAATVPSASASLPPCTQTEPADGAAGTTQFDA
jgi:hypothetical protein